MRMWELDQHLIAGWTMGGQDAAATASQLDVMSFCSMQAVDLGTPLFGTSLSGSRRSDR
jgi:hypothetical protein